jgi:RHS repeat-associated protein
VDTLLQDNQQLSLISTALQPQRFKKIIYDYDLISDNVNLVSYQDGQLDAFYHFYEYDADNRIIAVYSSNYPQKNALININTVNNSPLWDNDAKYFYYAHGPLARTEYGDNKVQGQDYAYTLQGWMKGLNSNTLDTARDIGKDGAIGSINSIFAKDAFGYTLNYHTNDYKAIDGLKWNTATNRFESIIEGSDLNNSRNDLFNGNITSMVTTIEKPMIYTPAANQAPIVMAQGTAYKYDQLNRLKEMKAFANLDFTTNTWQSGSTYAGMYHNQFNYDANGNIQYQQRADSTGTIFDKLSYRYKLDPTGRLFQNRLYHVNDSITNRALVKDDIDDEGTFTAKSDTINDINNYRYDELGELKHDSQEEIDSITWTLYGKIKKIIRTDTSSKPDFEFNYDAIGNRISKIVKPHGTSIDNGGTDIPTQWTSTYYIRDAEGNIMTTYKLAAPASASSFKVIERNMFGTSRLGTDNSQIELISALPTANPYVRTLGKKHYEASNHLGNVLTVFTDRKMPVTSDGITIDHFDADIVNTFDYSPFGAPMNERTYRLVMLYTDSTHINSVPAFVNGNEQLANIAKDSLSYRYGFNGKEKDNEIKGEANSLDFGGRNIYDPRLGRFFSPDPKESEYAWQSTYAYYGNSPIFQLDHNGEGGNSTHTDEKGNVLAVYNDGDNNVYKHGDDVKKWDGKSVLKKDGAEKVGETKYWDEFAKHDPKNNIIQTSPGNYADPSAKIKFGVSIDKYINDMYKISQNGMDNADGSAVSWLKKNSARGEDLDIKDFLGHSTGYLLGDFYVTGESAGNYLFGKNLAYARPALYHDKLEWWRLTMRQVGRYHNKSNTNLKKNYIVNNPEVPPYYGEIESSGRWISNGYFNINATKK